MDAHGRPNYCDHCDRQLSDPDDFSVIDKRPEFIGKAIDYLRLARIALSACGAPAATDYVRRALKSAEGAERHALGRKGRRLG
jgi:hypothetical protein